MPSRLVLKFSSSELHKARQLWSETHFLAKTMHKFETRSGNRINQIRSNYSFSFSLAPGFRLPSFDHSATQQDARWCCRRWDGICVCIIYSSNRHTVNMSRFLKNATDPIVNVSYCIQRQPTQKRWAFPHAIHRKCLIIYNARSNTSDDQNKSVGLFRLA